MDSVSDNGSSSKLATEVHKLAARTELRIEVPLVSASSVSSSIADADTGAGIGSADVAGVGGAATTGAAGAGTGVGAGGVGIGFSAGAGTDRASSGVNWVCQVCLKAGSAEVFGIELALKKNYHLMGGQKIAIFTWHGCELEVAYQLLGGSSTVNCFDMMYESDETACNVAYVNTHAQLEVIRDEAVQAAVSSAEAGNGGVEGGATSSKNLGGKAIGPRVLVAGAVDSGKTSLCLTLASYAAKVSRVPILVDLDVSGGNLLSVPGTISAAPITADALSFTTLQQQTGIDGTKVSTLVYWYGHCNVFDNTELYQTLVEKMASSVRTRMQQDFNNCTSGFIVNAMGSLMDASKPQGFELLKHTIESFDINVVLVMGHDRLYSMLKAYLHKQPATPGAAPLPKLIKVPKSGGLVSRNEDARRAMRASSILSYFYGGVVTSKESNVSAPAKESSQHQQLLSSPRLEYRFSPSMMELKFSEVVLVRVSQAALSKNALTIGTAQLSSKIQLEFVDAKSLFTGGAASDPESGKRHIRQMIHTILGVCHPSAVDQYRKLLKSAGAETAMVEGSGNDDGVYGVDDTLDLDDDIVAEAYKALYTSSVAGFVSIQKIDINTHHFTILLPCTGALPSKTFFLGDIAWRD